MLRKTFWAVRGSPERLLGASGDGPGGLGESWDPPRAFWESWESLREPWGVLGWSWGVLGRSGEGPGEVLGGLVAIFSTKLA